MSDKELEEVIAAITFYNDEQSFKKLYYFYFNKLYVLAVSILKSAEEAEEAVNDSLLGIWNNREQLKEVKNFKAYVFTTVRNKSINALAKMKPYQHLSIEDSEAVTFIAYQNAEDKFNAAELAKVLNQSVEKLPAQSKLIFRLVKESGFKHREVADLLNVSVKTIEYHIGTALKKIWETFNESKSSAQKKIEKK
jgi:RNA polymerase sigma-70 factor (family 1)